LKVCSSRSPGFSSPFVSAITYSRAVAKPMPLLPPVIKAVLVSSFIFGVVIKFSFALPISSYSKICETGVESGRFSR
jgi:hypothetical protein